MKKKTIIDKKNSVKVICLYNKPLATAESQTTIILQ